MSTHTSALWCVGPNWAKPIYATSDKKVVTFHTEDWSTGSHVRTLFCRVHLTGSRCRIWGPGAQNTEQSAGPCIHQPPRFAVKPRFRCRDRWPASSLRMVHVHPLMGLGGGWGLSVMKLTHRTGTPNLNKTSDKISERNGLRLRNVCHFDRLAKIVGDEIGQQRDPTIKDVSFCDSEWIRGNIRNPEEY